VNLGLFFWGVDKGSAALRFSRDFLKTLPQNASGSSAVSAPRRAVCSRQHHFAPGFALIVVGYGSPEEHALGHQAIRDAVAPLFELVTPMPYVQLQQMFDEANPWGTLAYEKALYLDELTDGAIQVFTEYLPKKTSRSRSFRLLPGRRVRPVPDDETAFGGSRKARYAFNISAVCPDPALYDGERSWVRSFWQALRRTHQGWAAT